MTSKNHVQKIFGGPLLVPLGIFVFFIIMTTGKPAAAQSSCATAPAGLVDWYPGDGSGLDFQGGAPRTERAERIYELRGHPSGKNMNSNFCGKCGATNAGQHNFCLQCGAALGVANTPSNASFQSPNAFQPPASNQYQTPPTNRYQTPATNQYQTPVSPFQPNAAPPPVFQAPPAPPMPLSQTVETQKRGFGGKITGVLGGLAVAGYFLLKGGFVFLRLGRIGGIGLVVVAVLILGLWGVIALIRRAGA
ncbi:MAG: hypothetical protein JSS81_12670 [Acidobacteria bacterium]|nr:hypothetical protein [Acidobacteriota bacterium]